MHQLRLQPADIDLLLRRRLDLILAKVHSEIDCEEADLLQAMLFAAVDTETFTVEVPDFVVSDI